MRLGRKLVDSLADWSCLLVRGVQCCKGNELLTLSLKTDELLIILSGIWLYVDGFIKGNGENPFQNANRPTVNWQR